ncbi:MAG: hypothetical protein ABH885_04835 [Candidatus Omnitrophota bacterium]
MKRQMSSLQMDFVAGHVRYQIDRLQAILKNLESDPRIRDEYVRQNLHQVESNIKKLRIMYEGL